MVEKNKNILIITSGAFLCVLAIMFFVTFKAKDNMIGSAGRNGSYSEPQLGDTPQCMVTSGPNPVYDYDGAFPNNTVGSCSSDYKKTGDCYEQGGTVDTSYCGSDDGLDCYVYRKYHVECTEPPTKTCYKLVGNECSQQTVSGTSCDNSDGYYDSKILCENNANGCVASRYGLNGNCEDCPSGYRDNPEVERKYITQCQRYVQRGYGLTFTGNSYQEYACGADTFASESRDVNWGSSSGCSPCPTGYSTNGLIGQTSCDYCASGYEKQGSECVKIAANETTCYKLAGNKCSQQTVSGSSCDTSNGYYNTLATCQSHISCGAGEGMDSSATTGCSTCASGYYSTATMNDCRACGTGATSTTDRSACTCTDSSKTWNSSTNTCDGGSSSSNVDCCYYSGGQYYYTSVPKTTCDDAYGGTQKSRTECEAQNSTTTCNVSNCQTCVSGNANKCQTCNTDYLLQEDGSCVYISGPCCINGVTTESSDECRREVREGGTIGLGTCDTLSGIASIEGNSSINIAADVGTVMGTYQARDSSNHIIQSGLTWEITGVGATKNVCNDGTCSINYSHQGTDSCGTKTTTVLVKVSDAYGHFKTMTVTVRHYCAWTVTHNTYVFSSTKSSRDSKKYSEGCIAYEGFYMEGGQFKYTEKYDRCCGCYPSTDDSTYCYFIKGSNGAPNSYCSGTQSQCPGYTTTIDIGDGECDEPLKCYQKKSDGTYHIGKYSGREDEFKLIGDTCPEPVTEKKMCYLKRGSDGSQNHYCYDTSSNCPGHTETVYGKDSEEACDEPIACYRRKADNAYVYGKYDGQTSIYTYVGATCPKAEPACYEKPNGERYWTSSPNPDDIELTSITDQATCENPDSGEKCYKDSSGGYHWAKTPGDASWVEQPGITKASDCADTEEPACYKKPSTGEYSWGKYSKVVGWEPVTEITDPNKCVRPDPACYVDAHGNYVWGNYEGQNSYTKVNKTEQECKSAIPVPPTAFDRYKVIYIAVCAFALAGVGMVMYVKKRKEMNIN